MTRYKPPQHPDDSCKREEQAQHIAAIGQQISTPLRDLYNQLTSLTNEIKSNNEETKRSKGEYDERYLFWTKISAITTGVLSFFSVLVAGAALYLLNSQNAVMRLDQRAWVGAIHAELEDFKEGMIPKVFIQFSNSGKTPAMDVTIGNMFLPMGGPPLEDPTEFMRGIVEGERVVNEKFPVPTPPTKTAIFPGGMAHKRIELSVSPLTRDGIVSIINRELTLVARSWIEYRDVFNILRHTEFCVYYIPGSQAFTGCPAGNSAD